ncbi:AraC family transcriptional regulator [Pyxidicoccus trucidator]|uniref:AraC family transcriptional regulator n=1 Tax=Pyxidicoccus trucidator TaxID=2709662 RepID=UPI0013D8F098|nr:AraC family transcriptional regulator [Pyxidicoccus trucidator]
MDREKQTASVLDSVDPGFLLASGGDGPRARLGLRVEFQTAGPGEMSLEAEPDHWLKIHAGTPLRGACRFHRFVYTQGDIDLCPAGTSDVWETQDASASVLIRLSPALLRRAAEDMGLNPDRAGLEPRHQFRDPQIEHIGWALDADRRAGHPGGLLYSECLGLALSVHLLGRYPAPLERERGLSKPQLRRVTEYIEEHLDQNLSLARLAGVASVSASHLKTLFKRSTGLPVHEYVVQRRVERARTLLQRGGLSAGEVALEAGFSHQSHMARCMRRVLGVTPTAVMRGARAR